MKTFCMLSVCAALCVTFFISGCTQQMPDNRSSDEAAIRQADAAWSKTAEAKDVEAHNAYFLEDGVVMASNEPIVSGKEAIRNLAAEMFAMPGFSIKWQATKVDVARSGDIGYSLGTYVMTFNDPAGMLLTDQGKYTTIWKKGADGSWKVAVDMFNSDLPMPHSSN